MSDDYPPQLMMSFKIPEIMMVASIFCSRLGSLKNYPASFVCKVQRYHLMSRLKESIKHLFHVRVVAMRIPVKTYL
jgi:hypothetical protein